MHDRDSIHNTAFQGNGHPPLLTRAGMVSLRGGHPLRHEAPHISNSTIVFGVNNYSKKYIQVFHCLFSVAPVTCLLCQGVEGKREKVL
jgi:hypothetical protein